MSEAKHEVWVIEDETGFIVRPMLVKAAAEREVVLSAGERVVRYVPEQSALSSAQGEGWVACSERLPDEDQLCVVLSEHWSGHDAPPELAQREGKASQVVWRRFLVDETDDEGPPEYIEHTVTHWMPLPPPPKAEGKP